MTTWREIKIYDDSACHKMDSVLRITFNRPEIHIVFRPQFIDEMIESNRVDWTYSSISLGLVTGNRPSPNQDKWVFCAGGSQFPIVSLAAVI